MLIILALGFMGNMVQSNSIGDAFHNAFGVNRLVVGVIVAAIAAFIFLGGVQRIAAVTEKVVPIMAAFYILGCIAILVINAKALPGALAQVFVLAFEPQAMAGGIAGVTVQQAMRFGVARGLFSNEAGLGTAPMAHAASTAESPLVQASIGMLDVFIDTLIVCSMTGFVILVAVVTPEMIANGTITNANVAAGSPLWCSGLNGGTLSALAFSSTLGGIGEVGVSISLVLFAFTTALGWCVYGERCVIYLFGDRAQMPFRIVYCLCMGIGALVALDLVWLIADTCNALMALPNLTGILLLSPVLFKYVREECAKDGRFVC